jgi:predicted Zn-dependent peptidase
VYKLKLAFVLLFVGLFVFGNISVAQQEEWRKKPPQIQSPRPFKLREIVSYKLGNGLDVQLYADKRVPFVTMNLGIKAGSAYDPKAKLGLADMTADMLVEGTKTKNSKQIASEIDFIGGAIKAGCDADFTFLVGNCLSKYTDKLLPLFADVLMNPSFPNNELKLKKDNLLQELIVKRGQPEFLLEEKFQKVLFGNHPYAVVAPEPETIEAITRDDLSKFHSEYYLPNISHLVVVGNFDIADMKALIEKNFAGWKSSQLANLSLAEIPKQIGRKIYLVDRPGSVQSNLKIGNVGIKREDPDYFRMLVANQILGGSTLSRLFLNVREAKGFTYGAYSNIAARKLEGPIAASASVRSDVTAPSLQEFMYELDRIRNTKVSDKELADAKNYLVGSFQLGLETQSGKAQRLLEGKLFDLPDNYLQTYTENIMAVNADDIRNVARKHIDMDNIVITVVGDATKIKPELVFFAPVEVSEAKAKQEKSAGDTQNKKSNSGS